MEEPVSLLLRLAGKNACPGDSLVSWLHYRLTTLLLVLSSLTLCFYEHFGKPISCITDNYSEEIYQKYCWVYGTVSVPDLSGEDSVSYTYYRWVWLVLLVQAALLYLPRLCWKRWRSEPIFVLLRPSDAEGESQQMLKLRAQKLASYVNNRGPSLMWFLSARCLCSVAYLAMVLVQMFLMDKLLNGAFLTYGIDILYRDEAMKLLFPKVTACEIRFYSEGGTLEKDTTLCVLPLNIFNEKLFVGMWFWFLFLAACSIFKMAFLSVAMSITQVRVFLLYWRCGFKTKRNVIQGLEELSVQQWYRLFVLSAQVDVDVFQKVVKSLVQQITRKKESFQKTITD